MKDTYDGQGQNILERVMQYAGKTRRDVSNPCITARDAIALADLLAEKQALLEATQKDAARLMFACEFDGYVGVEKDKYDYACECMDEAGRDEPNEEDELNGLRRLIDAKMDSKNSGDAT